MNEIKKNATVKIVTSGYSDRFLRIELKFFFGNAQFTSRNDLVSFMVDNMGKTWDDAWEMTNVETEYFIYGYTSPRSSTVCKIENSDVAKLQSFLMKNKRNVSELGFNESITAIMKWQLSECDRINTQHFGHPNGHEGK